MKNQNKKAELPKKGFGVGSRFSEGPAEEMIEYGIKLRIAEAKYTFPHELWNHQAHTIMLREQGIMGRKHAAAVLKALSEIESLGLDRFPLDPHKGELFHNIESYVIAKAGEDAGGRMHSGRSRGDMYVCSERMILREKILGLVRDIIALIETIVEVAEKNVETVMPGYTLLQHAQPTTFAHYLLSFADRYQRDIERLQETYRRVNRSPMGSAIVSGTGFPLNRPRMAELLGFDGVVENTRDASISRDFTLESITRAAILMSNISALADDLNIWCTYEFGMIELSDAYCGTSSIMPQKKNPSSLERMRYLSAIGMGNTMTVFAKLKTESEQLGDLEETGPIAWPTFDYAQMSAKLMRGVLSTLKVNRELMASRAGANFTQATQLAEIIVMEKGLAFRTAHRIVGRLVRNCLDRAKSPAEVSSELLDEASLAITGQPLRMKEETIRKAMDPRYIIENRNILGGPGKKQVVRMLKGHGRMISKSREWLDEQEEKITKAKTLVNSLMKRMMRGR
jgi:argininosuccinate lyase